MRPIFLAVAVAALVATAGSDARQPEKKADPKAKGDPKAKDEAEPKFNMKLKTADIRIGTQLTGAKLAPEDLTGKVVVLDYWGVNCPPCLAAMPGTAVFNAELADFGLVIIGAHSQLATPERIKAVAAGRGANFPITQQTAVAGGTDFQTIPHVMVFDHTGVCVYRGAQPKEAEAKARLAVGAMLVANAGREKFTPQLAGAVAELKKGAPPPSVVPRVVSQLNAPKEAGEDAKALLAALTATGQKKLEAAQEKADSEPLEAFLLVEKIPAAYKGTPLAKEATTLVTKLKKDKAVVAELAARPVLDLVRKMDAQLDAQPGAEKPTEGDFQKANAALLGQLKAKAAQMKKSWPDAKATAEALVIADRYGAAP